MCGAGLRVRCWDGGVGGRAKARAGRLGRVYRAQWLSAWGRAIVLVGQIRVLVQPTGAGLAAAAVKALAFIWKLVWMDFLTIQVI